MVFVERRRRLRFYERMGLRPPEELDNDEEREDRGLSSPEGRKFRTTYNINRASSKLSLIRDTRKLSNDVCSICTEEVIMFVHEAVSMPECGH